MFQCPKCKEDNLRIHHPVMHATDVNRKEEVADSEPGDLEWIDEDRAECLECDWGGTVREMTLEEDEEDSLTEAEAAADDRKDRERDFLNDGRR